MTELLHCTVRGTDIVVGKLLCYIQFEELPTALCDVTPCKVTEMYQRFGWAIYLNL